MAYLSDIEIAQSTPMQPITEIAKVAGVDDAYLEQYGKYKAKVDYNLLKNSDRKNGKLIKDLDISADKLAAIIKMVDSGEINRMNGRKTLTAVLEEGVDPVAYAKENGFDKKVDTATIEAIMDKVLAENTQALEDFRNGKVKAKQALFGACMRELKGIGDPAVIREMLDKKLEQ